MKISVALGTYNGQRFLNDQLQSIAAQDRRPDELVICDDGSSDETAAILRRFAATCPFQVRLEMHQRNLGASGNFSRAVASCRGEVIALCDQDDVWLPQKLARLEGVFAADPRTGFVFSDAILIDAESRRLRRRLWETLGFRKRWQRQINGGKAVDVLVKRNVVTGATMAFRSVHRDILLPIDGRWVHDGWFALLLAAMAPCRAIAEPLIEYRQHAGQQIGVGKQSLRNRFLREVRKGRQKLEIVADDCDAAQRRLSMFRSRLRNENVLRLLSEKAEHYRTRAQIRTLLLRRLPMIVSELFRGHYARLSENWKAVVQDLVLRSS
jgi:glycosyltransferase involved in cell wall biosynthesis